MGFSGPSSGLPPPPPSMSYASKFPTGVQAAMLPLEEVVSFAQTGKALGGPTGTPATPAASEATGASRRAAARYGGTPAQPNETMGAASSTGLKQLTGQ